MRILWVEDELRDSEAWVEAVGRELARRGGAMDFAVNVDEAVRRLDGCDYDTLVLDLNVPLGVPPSAEWCDGNLNGRYVVDHLKATNRLGIVRVICLTNLALVARTELGEGAGIRIVPKGSFSAEVKQAIFDDP